MDVRPSIKGGWYPQSPEVLAYTIENFLEKVDEYVYIDPPPESIFGLIVPHAGYVFSGEVAACAYKFIKGKRYDTVVILSPSHFVGRGSVITTAHTHYEIPFGYVEVSSDLVSSIRELMELRYGLDVYAVRNDPEHAVEVQLPFLRYLMADDFKIVPLMIYQQTDEVCRALSDVLLTVVNGKNFLVVASSDLSHYYPIEVARKLDKEMINRIQRFDPSGVLSAEREGVGYACGKGAIASALWLCKDLGASEVKILSYSTSGDVTGDVDSVVGYVSALVL